MVKRLINRLKKGVLIATAALFLQGCPCPWPDPSPEPTPIVSPTNSPSPSPSIEPTPTPTNTPIPYKTISGNLQDNETDTDKGGEVRVYINDVEDVPQRDTNGYDFSFSVPYGSNVKLKGQITEGDGSYVRTKDLGTITENETGINLRAVPYDGPLDYDNGLLDTPEKRTNFKEHAGRTNYWSDEERYNAGISGAINGNPGHGLKKWNHGEIPETQAPPILKGVKISKSIPGWADIKPIIQNSGYLGAGQIQIIEEDNPQPENGWGVILKSGAGKGAYTHLWDQSGEDGYIEHFEAYLNTTVPEIVIHEVIMHGLLAGAGHSNSATVAELPNLPSMWRWQSPCPTPNNKLTPADIKTNYIIDEETYKGMTAGDNIFGASF